VIATTKEGLLHRLENMGFNFYENGLHGVWTACFILDSMFHFGQQVLFWIYEYYSELFSSFMS
jgi:hypothetical protein